MKEFEEIRKRWYSDDGHIFSTPEECARYEEAEAYRKTFVKVEVSILDLPNVVYFVADKTQFDNICNYANSYKVDGAFYSPGWYFLDDDYMRRRGMLVPAETYFDEINKELQKIGYEITKQQED